MPESPLILITNDDGLLSPGLHAAAEAVADLGDLLLAAPATQQTAMSRAFVTRSVPAIQAEWYADDRGCLYAMTDDGNFVVDRIPGRGRLFAAGGGSGHGFKLGPAVGRLAADLVTTGRPPVAAFRFDAVRDGRVT